MSVSELIRQARGRYGHANSLILSSKESTGEIPSELFVTDEHTENYLALKAGGEGIGAS